MPKIKANGVSINYGQQGTGEPLILIPYLAADHACYAFQVAEYAKHFTCISVDLPGTGESDQAEGPYTTEDLADDVAAFIRALGIFKVHVSGLSLGAAIGMWLAGKYPDLVASLSLHSGWHKSDPFLKAVVQSFQAIAKGMANVSDMVVAGIFPWCFTPELYATKPDYIQSLADFVRSRPAQSLSSFLNQSNAVISHDAEAQLARITAPTQITFGRYDLATSTRFVEPLKKIKNSELLIFEGASHAPIYEKVEEFNRATLHFLTRHSGHIPAASAGG
jgi:pimeloyl-ACP methyl ester carboxylesterase